MKRKRKNPVHGKPLWSKREFFRIQREMEKLRPGLALLRWAVDSFKKPKTKTMATKIQVLSRAALRTLPCWECGKVHHEPYSDRGLSAVAGDEHRLTLGPLCHKWAAMHAVYDAALNTLALFCAECGEPVVGVNPE